MDKMFKAALEYVRDNVEQIDIQHALDHMEREHRPLYAVDSGLEAELERLMDEFGDNNGLDEGWWRVHQDCTAELIDLVAKVIWPSGRDDFKYKNLISAPLNQKDILEDCLFEELFSDGWNDYVENNGQVLGWIHGIPAMVEWTFNSNHIKVTPLSGVDSPSGIDAVADMIERRLTLYNDDEQCATLCATSRSYGDDGMPIKIHARYYYKPDENE